jgi:hypothetical protein
MKKQIFTVILAGVTFCSTVMPSAGLPQKQYKPVPLTSAQITDILTDKDIPTGQKGFAKDYQIEAIADDRLEISVSSSAFDTIISVLGKDGDVIAENDDGSSDGTDSLLFIKIKKAGSYIVRVQSFGGSSGGKFTLKVTKLRPVN